MAKRSRNKKRGFVHIHHLTRMTAAAGIGILVFGGVFYSYAATPTHLKVSPTLPKTITHHPLKTNKTTKPVAPSTTTTPTTTPKQSTTPATQTPAATTTPTPAPQPTQPVAVVPSPSSSVDSLTPTSTSSTSTSSSGSTQTQTSSSPNSSPILPATSYSSTNWSGYLSAGGYYTAVSASWVAPTVDPNVTAEAGDATWIGIGGVTSNDLIQIGTENMVEPNGQVATAAFYELLPDVSQPVPGVTVHPGDTMTASISQVSSTRWSMSISDQTTGQSYTSVVTYTSTNSSAEWVEEAPTYASGGLVPLDNFGTINFTSASTTVNGTAMNLSSAQGSSITMVANPGHVVVAQPSALGSDNASFTVTRKNT